MVDQERAREPAGARGPARLPPIARGHRH
jgi:hypothetical protein